MKPPGPVQVYVTNGELVLMFKLALCPVHKVEFPVAVAVVTPELGGIGPIYSV